MKTRTRFAVLALCAALGAAVPALAFGPMSAPPDDGEGGELSIETYALMGADADSAAGEAGGLPAELAVVDANGAVRYRETAAGSWQVTIEVAEQAHEAADAVYDLVVALALPAGFHTDAWRIGVREGSPDASVPVVYAGEKLRLKRNLALETSWLPLLVGGEAGLPDLSDTDYVWTLWDTIVRYDEEAGPFLQGFATLDYSADASVPAPDPEDPRSAAYVISWVPSLDAAIAPHALRLDAAPPDEE
jgi:hypothetical protein